VSCDFCHRRPIYADKLNVLLDIKADTKRLIIIMRRFVYLLINDRLSNQEAKTIIDTITKTKLGMSVLCEYATAEYFTYCRIFHIFQQSAHITYFFPHRLAFSTAILILVVFLLPISITFRYLDHLVAKQNGTIHVSGPQWNEMG